MTGLNATDNPGPGVAVLRSLRASARPGERLVGLTYDALDPGLYTEGLADASYLLTYPSSGCRSVPSRLRQVHERVGLDVIVPTLDAELPLVHGARTAAAGDGDRGAPADARPSSPSGGRRRSRRWARRAGLDVPATAIVGSADELKHVHTQVPYPFFVKGPFYGATRVGSYEEAVAAYYRALVTWGGPVIVQALVHGEEVNVVGVGDGDGGLWGAVAMKKLALTDKGKGWAGVTIDDRRLLALAEKFVSFTRWPGPFEAEVIRIERRSVPSHRDQPALPRLGPPGDRRGVNLPRAVVELARGNRPPRPETVRGREDVRPHLHRSDRRHVRLRFACHDRRNCRCPTNKPMNARASFVTRWVASTSSARTSARASSTTSTARPSPTSWPSTARRCSCFRSARSSSATRSSSRPSCAATRACGSPGRTRPTTCRRSAACSTSEGAWAEVVSPFEYDKAIRAGVPPERIHFNGPFKPDDALARSIDGGSFLHVDDFDEIARIERIAERLGKTARVAIRVNMSLDGVPSWSRFGLNLESGQAAEAAARIVGGEGMDLVGLHTHIGTFMLDPDVVQDRGGQAGAARQRPQHPRTACGCRSSTWAAGSPRATR